MLIIHNKHNKIITPALSFINLNFTENGKHGCRFNCPYCMWKKEPLGSLYMNPTNENLKDFASITTSEFMGLAGGGDPLYHFEKNRNELKRIIDFIHSRDRKVFLITSDYETVGKYIDDDVIQSIDRISFSVDGFHKDLLPILDKLGKEKTRVTTVVNTKSKYMPIEYVKKYLNFYKDHCFRFQIREDYTCEFNEAYAQQVKKIADEYNFKYNLFIYLTDETRNMMILINNHVYLASDVNNNELEGITC